jgi:hypothetical protein
MKNQHFRRFALGVNTQITVEKTNAPDLAGSTVRSDHNSTCFGGEMAKATDIFDARILCNPSCGSARP